MGAAGAVSAAGLTFWASTRSSTAPIPRTVTAPLVTAGIIGRFPWLRHVFADGGYAGDKLRAALDKIGKWTLEIIKRPDTARSFKLMPRGWVVERTFAWLDRNRRLAKAFENAIESATAWLFMASVQRINRKLARPCNHTISL